MRSLGDVFYNFHWIEPGELARSAQAYLGFLGPFLKRHRIRSVINLRGANPHFWWWRYEKSVCKRLGIAHVDIPLNSRNLPSRQMLLNILEAVDTAERPTMIKCSGGQDRTSFAVALYIVHRHGWDHTATAVEQFSTWPYLHLPKQQQRWLKLFLQYAREHSGGKSLSEWVRQDYAPEGLREWLISIGMPDAFRT
jgi:protein tyrosine/serine phosphatase